MYKNRRKRLRRAVLVASSTPKTQSKSTALPSIDVLNSSPQVQPQMVKPQIQEPLCDRKNKKQSKDVEADLERTCLKLGMIYVGPSEQETAKAQKNRRQQLRRAIK